ncbi:MAG: hypothetical protein K6E29_03320 [Cyanobacteria bacterium RUI128]|nr:hypothetical protein [Cyanobacteria bacterium RUI128]
MNYVFLDFDGVLFDTLREAYILCRYAYDGTDYFEPVNEEEYKKLYRYKFLVYNSWHYYYLMSLIRQNLTDSELIAEYKKLLNNRDTKAEKLFDEKYYSARKDLMENHHDFWDKLESPFQFFYELKQHTDGLHTPIVSKKNKKAIIYRLSQYGLNLDENQIFGKDELEGYATKADFIAEYININRINRAYFIDDNSNNLKPCEKFPEITPLLAGWGNIAIEEKGLSYNEIINIIFKN